MFRWLSNLFAAKPTQALARRAVRMLRARYDAAVTTDDNRRHWANADGLSANAANSAEVRRILRNRARYEVANNSYARGIVLTLANDVIGTGPRLQLLTDDAEANRRIEQEFARWSKAVGLAEKLRTMRMARAQDGEAFAVLTSNPKLTTPVQLDLRLIEADQVATPDPKALGENAVDGIVFDPFGNPVEYHVLREHPGETARHFILEYDRVPAESVLHWFRADRPGQARGVPDILPALPLFAQLRRFTLAVIAAAETAADFAGILYTDAPAGGESEAAEPFEPIELEQRALVTMPGGWKMSQLEAQQPATTYAEFKREILNEIARCLNMPFNVAAGNSSGYNYASGRLDHQTYFKAIRVEQAHLECAVLDRILAAWLDEAALIPGLLPAGLGADRRQPAKGDQRHGLRTRSRAEPGRNDARRGSRRGQADRRHPQDLRRQAWRHRGSGHRRGLGCSAHGTRSAAGITAARTGHRSRRRQRPLLDGAAPGGRPGLDAHADASRTALPGRPAPGRRGPLWPQAEAPPRHLPGGPGQRLQRPAVHRHEQPP